MVCDSVCIGEDSIDNIINKIQLLVYVLARTTLEEEKELMHLDLELFFGLLLILVQMQWIALIIIIIELIVDLALTSKEHCKHTSESTIW